MILQHQSKTNEHYTPPAVVSLARETMNGIDLDPCTNRAVNEWSVWASHYCSLEEGHDGLDYLEKLPSGGYLRAWVNPPGGKTGNKSNLKTWLETFLVTWERQAIGEGFFLLFNREHLGDRRLAPFPRLNFEKRLRYWSQDASGEFREGNYNSKGIWTNSPTQASSLLYFPPRDQQLWAARCQLLLDVWGDRFGSWVVPSEGL